jgi:hypothetical protein
MALADHLKGPEHKVRSLHLEGELTQLQQRYMRMQGLAKKNRALEAQEVQVHLREERKTLQTIQSEVLADVV